MRRPVYAILALAVFVLASCSGKGIIPRSDMAEITADLFMVDQWFEQNQRYARMTDTSLVYAEVFEKYGYTGDDYLKSLDYYMLDSDRYVKVVKKSRSILEKRLKAVNDSILADDSERKSGFILDSIISSLPPIGYFHLLSDTTDLLSVDSLGGISILTDTLFSARDTAGYVFCPADMDSMARELLKAARDTSEVTETDTLPRLIYERVKLVVD